jgi:hypothetical protein
MELRCKVGDVAFIRNDEFPENIGIFLEVVEAYEEAPIGTWGWKNSSRPIKIKDDDNGSISYRTESEDPDYFAYVEDKDLVPIRYGPGDEEFVKEARDKLKDSVKESSKELVSE